MKSDDIGENNVDNSNLDYIYRNDHSDGLYGFVSVDSTDRTNNNNDPDLDISTNINANVKVGNVDNVSKVNSSISNNRLISENSIDIGTSLASEKSDIDINTDIGTNFMIENNVGNVNSECTYSINHEQDVFKVDEIINGNGNSVNGIVDSNDTIDGISPGDILESGFVNDIDDKSPNDIKSVLIGDDIVSIINVVNVDVCVKSEKVNVINNKTKQPFGKAYIGVCSKHFSSRMIEGPTKLIESNTADASKEEIRGINNNTHNLKSDSYDLEPDSYIHNNVVVTSTLSSDTYEIINNTITEKNPEIVGKFGKMKNRKRTEFGTGSVGRIDTFPRYTTDATIGYKYHNDCYGIEGFDEAVINNNILTMHN